MIDWANFFLWAIREIVSTVFSLDLGFGITLGDLDVACLVIGLVATALIIKTGSFATFQGNDVSKEHFEKLNKRSNSNA